MKKIKYLLFIIFLFGSFSLFAQEKVDSFAVYGNCGMCKKRIEKAAKIEGVSQANWDSSTKLMTVTYDASMVSNKIIQQKIADVGHDTDLFMAKDKVYDKLPGCCLYERKSSNKSL